MGSETLLALIGIIVLQSAPLDRPAARGVGGLPTAKYVSPSGAAPVKKDALRLGVEVTAQAAVVMDARTGAVLFEKDANRALPVASLTKIVTAMVLLDQKPNMDEVVALAGGDRGRIGRSFVDLNDSFSRGELLQIMLVASSNEAASALARTSLGSEGFVKAMNAKAKELGMANAAFYDPTGLDPRNVATAREVAFAMRAALNYPEIRAISPKNTFLVRGRSTGRSYTLKNTNLLLDSNLNREPYRVVAGKTGSLEEAGFCFAQITVDKTGREVISVVLGSESHYSRFQDVKSMTYWAYDAYAWPVAARS